MSVAYINIGSNLGDRKANINKALEWIGIKFGPFCVSEVIESEPWGFDSSHHFLNIGVAFKTDLAPEELLDCLKEIEKTICSASHRDSKGCYIDRVIDIDIMAIDEIKYQSERLTIPHSHLLERDFFLLPLKELNPDWQNP